MKSRVGLRTRLAAAFVGVAVFAVGTAIVLDKDGVGPLVADAAHARLQASAARMARVAAAIYSDEGGWTPRTRSELIHLAAVDALDLAIRRPDGTAFLAMRLHGPRSESMPIRTRGQVVGTLLVSPGDGQLLSPADTRLEHSLGSRHLIAGLVAALGALAVAVLLAETLSRPLRRIRHVADRIERGDLDARVDCAGVSELSSIGQALNRLAETLTLEETARKQNLADLAHELRTPVHGLLSRVEAAQDGVLENDRPNLRAMHVEALRLTRLLDDLGRLAEAERPGLLLEKRTVDLGAVVRRHAEAFAARFAAANVGFQVRVEQAPITADADRIGQIIDNLLENALRYTEAGAVSVGVTSQEGTAVLEVVDTGIGIAGADLEDIFKRFWRGEKSRSRARGGAGIGLTIVRELVRAHEGRIEVASALGEGSRFRVRLPLADASQPAVGQAAMLAEAS